MKSNFSQLVIAGLAIFATFTLSACGGGSDTVTSEPIDSEKNTEIAVEKLGTNGEYDENGLAKRVAAALDNTPNIADLAKVYVAQKGDTVILKGNVADRSILEQVLDVVKSVRGVGEVDTDGLTLR